MKLFNCFSYATINKKFFAASALILLLSLSAMIATMPVVNASDPPIEVPTYAYLAVTPNPVGIGQPVFLVMWLHAAPPTAAGDAGDRWHDFTIEVTKPDGTKENKGPFFSDPTGSTYTTYTPDQLGTYTFVFRYSGQVLSLNNPINGLPGTPSPFVNDTFLPSETTVTLTVQQDPIAPVEEYPLPTGYWTRPISADNILWANVASNWLGGAQSGGYNLWQTGSGPSSPHILWTRPIELGGVVGGFWPQSAGYTSSVVPSAGFYSGGSYEGRFTNSLILGGMLFYNDPLGHSAVGGGYTALDLKTGEVRWHSDDINVYTGQNPTNIRNNSASPSIPGPSFGQLYVYESPNQHGSVGGILWQSSTAGGVTTWQGFDAFTGKWVFNETGVPAGFEVYTNKGEIVRYVLSYSTTGRQGSLSLWNNTQEQIGLHLGTGPTTNAWQWRPNGKSVNMSNAYSWNVSITADLTGNSAPAIVQVLPGDIILGRSSAISPGVGDKFTPDPYTFWAISDKPESRGQLLWKQSYPAPENNITRRFMTLPIDPVNRVIVMHDVETMQFVGYDLDNGQLLWGPTNIPQRAYTYYGSGEGGGQRGTIAYGNLYVQGFGGELLCINTENGNLVWKYNNTNSGLDTPWGLRPIFLGAIADGKVYAFNNEHSPNDPLYRGNSIYCIDAFTGEEIYKMLSWAGQSGGRGTSTTVLADGVLCYYNYYDNSIYAIGKGPSATTVEAPLTSIAQGAGVVIRGTVTDQSAGAKAKVAEGFFTSVPAISDESQARWMEYVYMQKPMPTNATGVPVKIFVTDANNNTNEIATVTSNTDGVFYYEWVPPQAGAYTVNAVFEGSNSYGPSSASTVVAVGTAAPGTSPTPTPTGTPAGTPTGTVAPTITPSAAPPTAPITTETLLIIGAAIVIIVVIVAAAILLRRRQ